MTRTPRDALKHAGKPLTAEGARRAYAKIVSQGIDFRKNHPPRLDRRYIIVGGSGLVGCQIALDLLDGGTPPSAIRLIDIRHPLREEFTASGRALHVAFIQADITSETSTAEAFEAAWPGDVADLPLTVFHTAAVIRPYERHRLLYSRCSRVNVVGVAHSISCAQKVGAGVFVSTSSSHAAARNVGWFSTPWLKEPKNFTQLLSEQDFSEPIKKHDEFVSNYARSKAEAERLVCGVNGRMRTGCIRPGNAVYGHKDDNMIGRIIRLRKVPTFSAPWVQSWVSVRNVSLAHLLLEKEILGPYADKISGRPFMVTDNGSPIRFQDMYTLLGATSRTGLTIDYPPPALLLMVAYLVEWYCVMLARAPFLKTVLSEPVDPLILFQPGTVGSSASQIVTDEVARGKPEEGGLGYRGYCSTLEGMCMQVEEWNRHVDGGGT
ncbi:hypothetical protein QQS21_003421 [Conoideocrella luteorostrata]|uniref:3-beta hydroxysteroid dehydrogenase/isomerase domain-containing protein n=1 Tax=Conoideocrella luteorostrata TaxID=1105319 RepID=A0AAJ0FWD1_9HYPO|nr:hypothetical protein QQS21_003421 [Conoideocrella luteorostrata]